MDPFATTSDQAIEFGIAYEEPAEEESVAMAAFENRVGSLEATRTFTIPRSPDVSVMVKDIDRLNIPGSFVVQLLANGEPVAERAFFQPETPRDCATCRKLGLISVNFRVEQEKVVDKKLSIAIEIPSQAESIGARFRCRRPAIPPSMCGCCSRTAKAADANFVRLSQPAQRSPKRAMASKLPNRRNLRRPGEDA